MAEWKTVGRAVSLGPLTARVATWGFGPRPLTAKAAQGLGPCVTVPEAGGVFPLLRAPSVIALCTPDELRP